MYTLQARHQHRNTVMEETRLEKSIIIVRKSLQAENCVARLQREFSNVNVKEKLTLRSFQKPDRKPIFV